jgi:hypothetical protein
MSPIKPYPDHSEKEVSQFNELDLSGTYSYANYLRWKFDERLELIKGKIFQMRPCPLQESIKKYHKVGPLYKSFSKTSKCC